MAQHTITPVRVIADSLVNDIRVTTLEVTFPRFILPEFNTHRVFSRNSASSRARSVKRTFTDVMEMPFIPRPFTQNQKGMSGAPIKDEQLQAECEHSWLAARNAAVLAALDLLVGSHKRSGLIGGDAGRYLDVIESYDMALDEPSVHKQHVNRLLEPFMYHTAVVTSTMWDNFFELRIAPDAQPEIYELAVAMKQAFDESTPVERQIHIPYVSNEVEGALETAAGTEISPFVIKLSAASCASVSYKNPDELALAAVERIFTMMHADKHMSPFEHVACAPAVLGDLMQAMEWKFAASYEDQPLAGINGNLSEGVVQLRKVMERLA